MGNWPLGRKALNHVAWWYGDAQNVSKVWVEIYNIVVHRDDF